MIDQIKNKLNNLNSSSGSSNAVRTDSKQVKTKVQKIDSAKSKIDIDGGKAILADRRNRFNTLDPGDALFDDLRDF